MSDLCWVHCLLSPSRLCLLRPFEQSTRLLWKWFLWFVVRALEGPWWYCHCSIMTNLPCFSNLLSTFLSGIPSLNNVPINFNLHLYIMILYFCLSSLPSQYHQYLALSGPFALQPFPYFGFPPSFLPPPSSFLLLAAFCMFLLCACGAAWLSVSLAVRLFHFLLYISLHISPLSLLYLSSISPLSLLYRSSVSFSLLLSPSLSFSLSLFCACLSLSGTSSSPRINVQKLSFFAFTT